MNTDGMNLGLAQKGAAELRSPRMQANSRTLVEDKMKPDSFASMMREKSPISKDPRTRFDMRSAPQVAKSTAPKDNSPSVQKAKTTEYSEQENQDTAGSAAVSANDKNAESQSGSNVKNVSARQSAMLKFMDSMESEFGIPPQKLVEAMATLPQDQLLAKPEETAEQVIEQLDLPPGQAEKAMAMYAGLLEQLMRMPMQNNPESKQPDPAYGGFGLNMQQKQLEQKNKREMLSDSLDRMNKKFFLNDRAVTSEKVLDHLSQPTVAAQAKPVDQMADQLMYNRMIGSQNEALNQIQENKLNSQFGNNKAPNSAQMNEQQALDGLMEKLAIVGASAEALGQAAQKMQTQGGAPGQNSKVASDQNAEGFFGGQSMANMGLAGLGAAGSQEFQASADSDESEMDKESQDKGLSLDKNSPLLRGDHLLKSEANMSFQETLATGAPGAVTVNPQDRNANIEKLISQAKIVVQKGGGEATVRMSPEGIGDVQMKVMVKDGKVNVEMSTQSKEAQKLIESSLSDLKAGLGQHRLSVENIKVDTSLGSSGDMSHANRNPDFRQDPSREQARQFFQNFRDENASRRDPFLEMPAIKGYARGQRSVSEVNGHGEVQSQARVKGRGERMNIVA